MLTPLVQKQIPEYLVILGARWQVVSPARGAPASARSGRPSLSSLAGLRPERAAILGESGLLRVLERALDEHRVAVPRADIRRAIDSGVASLRPLLTQLIDKAQAALVLDEAVA